MRQITPYTIFKFIVNRLHVDRNAASRYPKELESIGILKPYKAGRETLFINTSLIDLLRQ